jgi:hypothetical protein
LSLRKRFVDIARHGRQSGEQISCKRRITVAQLLQVDPKLREPGTLTALVSIHDRHCLVSRTPGCERWRAYGWEHNGNTAEHSAKGLGARQSFSASQRCREYSSDVMPERA